MNASVIGINTLASNSSSPAAFCFAKIADPLQASKEGLNGWGIEIASE